MIRKTTNCDINDEEFNEILKPFLDNYDEKIESYIIHEVIAYYITNSYYRNAMYEGSFLQHYNFLQVKILVKCRYYLTPTPII